MKKFIFVLFLAFVTISCAQEKEVTPTGPKIFAHEMKVDFGDINEGEKIVHEFVIENQGDETLKIAKVKASCGCTAATPEKNDLEPGEKTNIKVTFNSKGRHGKQNKHVYVFSNDKETPQLRLSFSTNIISEKVDQSSLENSPRLDLAFNQYNFNTVKEGSIAKGNLAYRNNGKSDLEIKDIQSSCECTTASFSAKNLKPGEEGVLNFEFDTSGRSGSMSRTLIVTSNDPVSPKQVVTLFIKIES